MCYRGNASTCKRAPQEQKCFVEQKTEQRDARQCIGAKLVQAYFALSAMHLVFDFRIKPERYGRRYNKNNMQDNVSRAIHLAAHSPDDLHDAFTWRRDVKSLFNAARFQDGNYYTRVFC